MIRIACVMLLGLLCACDRETPSAAATAPEPAPVATGAVPAPPTAPAEPAAEPGFELPGDYAQSTTLADLQQRFGADEVRVVEAPQEDGSVRRSVVLFPDDPGRRAYVDFHDPESLTGVANIAVRDAGSRWRGKGGVRVGMSFAELRRINGRPFLFSGFDEQGRAWVRDAWSPALDDVGGLGALDVGEGEHMYFGVDLGLAEAAGAVAPDAVPHDEYSALSDDPRWPRLGEIAEVTAISAYTSLDDEWE